LNANSRAHAERHLQSGRWQRPDWFMQNIAHDN
jgi:hypothetical protein